MSDESDLKLARECAAKGLPNIAWAKLTLSGEFDDDPEVQSALRAIKAERARRDAQTVAWLREQSAKLFRLSDGASDREVAAYNHTRGIAVGMAADAIERNAIGRGEYEE